MSNYHHVDLWINHRKKLFFCQGNVGVQDFEPLQFYQNHYNFIKNPSIYKQSGQFFFNGFYFVFFQFKT